MSAAMSLPSAPSAPSRAPCKTTVCSLQTASRKPQAPRVEVACIWLGDEMGTAVPVTSPCLRASQVKVQEVPEGHQFYKEGVKKPSLGLFATARPPPPPSSTLQATPCWNNLPACYFFRRTLLRLQVAKTEFHLVRTYLDNPLATQISLESTMIRDQAEETTGGSTL